MREAARLLAASEQVSDLRVMIDRGVIVGDVCYNEHIGVYAHVRLLKEMLWQQFAGH